MFHRWRNQSSDSTVEADHRWARKTQIGNCVVSTRKATLQLVRMQHWQLCRRLIRLLLRYDGAAWRRRMDIGINRYYSIRHDSHCPWSRRWASKYIHSAHLTVQCSVTCVRYYSMQVITFSDLVTSLPFETTVDSFDIRGDYLKAALEHSVSYSTFPDFFSTHIMMQMSGLKVVYNITRPVNDRVLSVDVLCQKCLVPTYEPLDLTKTYRVIAQSFLAQGGDNFLMLSSNKKNYKWDISPIVECMNLYNNQYLIRIVIFQNRRSRYRCRRALSGQRKHGDHWNE